MLDGWRREEERARGDGAASNNDTTDDDGVDNGGLSFDEIMLQWYILLCAQDVNGGLRDKPSKPKDFYHSCYNLSGLSVAQHALTPWPPSPRKETGQAEEKGARGRGRGGRPIGCSGTRPSTSSGGRIL